MQTQGQGGAAGGSAPKFNGVLDCVKTTVTNEGVQGLYKGLSTPLLMTGFVNSLLFGMQVRRPWDGVREREREERWEEEMGPRTCLSG
jgi:hypothetical protein